ncbi:MAG TPA: glycosyltransferase family 4 protein [Levilinea sp.]|nr:glycosyltransferase family 4 protein [Levilinea sp.]
MHILLVHQAFATIDEAGGTRHYELAQYLVERGHRVTVVTSPVSYLTGKSSAASQAWIEQDRSTPGIEILRSYTYHAFHRSFFHRLISFFSFMVSSFIAGLGVGQVDLVWGTSPPIFQGVTAWMLARLKGVPFLFEVRDLWPAFAIGIGVLRNPLLIQASLWLERFLYRHADRVMVNSPGFIDHVTARGARRVELVPNGADPAMFHPEDDGHAFRQQYGLQGKFIVLYAGAHGMSNDLDVVLDAAKRLDRYSPVCFVLVGDGKEKPALEAQAEQLGITNVLFLPPVVKSRMPEALAAADACLAILKPLDLFKTTYPNKVFDYMAAGRPVVLAIDGVIREVVENACAGVFTPPGDAERLAQVVQKLSADPDSARRLGRNGREYISRHFARPALAQQLTLLLQDMWRKHG